MATVVVNGVEHYYEWIAEADSPGASGRPVMVFLHGWAGSARYWESTAQALKSDFDCLLYDMRGFGRTQAPAAEQMVADPSLGSLESFAEDLRILLDQLGLSQPVYLNAHSMGGTVGLYFLDRCPERVQKAIFTCNGSFEYDQRAFEAFYRFGGYVVAVRPKWLSRVPLAPQMFMSRFLRRSIPLAEKQAFLKDFLVADGATAVGTLRAAVSKHATEVMPAAFSRVQRPALMISGEYDKITPAELGRQAAAMSDQIEYVLMKETAHFPMLEDPATYLEVVLDFVRAKS
ncbi:alpha/beta hydrolase [Romeria aff. gracilis LEGE 07310]|uniref:Alpha/beta hydrolase n=1 Tax=Vasconcelosia minhoensis LEGE 07310 TaxID=915328 RepID=A0A8J7DLW5_9CYAN|nr:alpha/beta hydrolase [Romeria gracilis]MBE9077841.1 alpha/beta hydrolase [Romeria aff. gracilis LEGE 07310]